MKAKLAQVQEPLFVLMGQGKLPYRFLPPFCLAQQLHVQPQESITNLSSFFFSKQGPRESFELVTGQLTAQSYGCSPPC